MRDWMHDLEGGGDPDLKRSVLSKSELDRFRAQAIDGSYSGMVQRDSTRLTDEELCQRIRERNAEGKPVARLLAEYQSRLDK